ncbi:MAG: hypothetical protein H6737_19025 [Alphaproteobacteria bacterium]|nr:hypothetical protein [Alphaproteobacteria bacterium]
MIRRILAFVPLAAVVFPWLVLRLLGGREAVVILTGMIPAGMGVEAIPLGLGFVFAHLALVVCGPPLAVFGLVQALPFPKAADPAV